MVGEGAQPPSAVYFQDYEWADAAFPVRLRSQTPELCSHRAWQAALAALINKGGPLGGHQAPGLESGHMQQHAAPAMDRSEVRRQSLCSTSALADNLICMFSCQDGLATPAAVVSSGDEAIEALKVCAAQLLCDNCFFRFPAC
jgi:hypothetical protein